MSLIHAPGARGIAIKSPVENQRDQWVDQQMSTPVIPSHAIQQFIVRSNPTTKGIDVAFQVVDKTGVASVTLLRAQVMDIKQAIVLQSWSASASAFTWSDTDTLLQQMGQAYYWLKLEPVNTNGAEVTVGPQYILLNPSLLPPVALAAISASHAAAVNGTVLVTCNVSAIPVGDSVKIYVSGYEGNPSAVAVAQRTNAPLQFNLNATGETITIKAIAVSSGGAEAATGPTCTLTLNGTATAPAQVQNVEVVQISTGNQVQWPASLETGITQYKLYRGQRGLGFGASSLLATIAATSTGEIIYLDTGGLSGDWEYYVTAISSSGTSPASPAANPLVLYSSSQLPPNTPSNQIGGGTIDSIDGGSSATIRIYGGGGPGTGWTKTTGYGTATRPAGSITGLAYNQLYFVLYQVATGTYLGSTSYSDTMPDGYEWVGTIATCPPGGTATATATAFINAGVVVGVGVVSPGYGYGTASCSFSGGGGSGAAATVFCSAGRVSLFNVTNQGSGYTSAPAVTVNLVTPYSGGGGGSTNGGSRYVLSQP